MNSANHECSRCNGKGKIEAFSHVIGGVCLKCGGSGRQKAARGKQRSFRYAVFLPVRGTDKVARVYNLTARHAGHAVDRAALLYANGSSAFRDEHTMHGAFALRVDELDDPEMVELTTEVA